MRKEALKVLHQPIAGRPAGRVLAHIKPTQKDVYFFSPIRYLIRSLGEGRKRGDRIEEPGIEVNVLGERLGRKADASSAWSLRFCCNHFSCQTGIPRPSAYGKGWLRDASTVLCWLPMVVRCTVLMCSRLAQAKEDNVPGSLLHFLRSSEAAQCVITCICTGVHGAVFNHMQRWLATLCCKVLFEGLGGCVSVCVCVGVFIFITRYGKHIQAKPLPYEQGGKFEAIQNERTLQLSHL